MADNHQFKQLNDIYDGAAYLVAKDGLDVIDALETSILKWRPQYGRGCECAGCLQATDALRETIDNLGEED